MRTILVSKWLCRGRVSIDSSCCAVANLPGPSTITAGKSAVTARLQLCIPEEGVWLLSPTPELHAENETAAQLFRSGFAERCESLAESLGPAAQFTAVAERERADGSEESCEARLHFRA